MVRRNLQGKETNLTAKGENAREIADVLNATNLKILDILNREKLDISTIAKRISLSEGHVSEEIRRLEDLNLVQANYERGKRGTRKVCHSNIKEITIIISE